jgi:hypothetical protein
MGNNIVAFDEDHFISERNRSELGSFSTIKVCDSKHREERTCSGTK